MAVPLRHRQRLTGYFVFDCGRSSEIRPERVAAILCVIGELVADVAESRTHEQFRRKRLMDENRRLRLLLGESPQKGLIGSGAAMREISAQIRQVAATDATVLVARGKSIAVADLPDTVRAAPGALGTSASPDGTAPATAVTDAVALTDAPLSVQLRDFEKRLLEYTLEKTQGNYAAAARRLGLSPRMMYYRARGVGIDRSPSAT